MHSDPATTKPVHYAINYTADAPAGCPPVVMADQVLRYADSDDVWLCFLLTPPPGSAHTEPWAVWRTSAEHVLGFAQFPDLPSAMAAAFG